MIDTTGYADLELRILARGDGGYPVEMTLESEQEYGPCALATDVLPWVPTADPAADGVRLFERLFADGELRAAWGEIRGRHPQRRVRLRIDAAAPELHALPWELLRDPGGPASQDLAASEATPFSRYLAGRWQPGHPIFQRPLRILAAIANPQGLERYRLRAIEVEKEIDLLRAALEDLDAELTVLPQPCTLRTIEEAVKDGYHILHFVGHGRYSTKSGSAALFLAGDDNQLVLESDENVAAMLARQLADADARRDDKLRLVFLASCQTADRSPADAFRGLAPRLVSAGVPAVLAMQDLVAVDTARELAGTFYRRLLAHGRADLAANEARSAVRTARLPGAAVPVLFQRLRSGALLAQRGRISSDDAGDFWPFLVEILEEGDCVPFLGPRVTTGLISDRAQVASKLAEKYAYPLADGDDLTRVAQFMALKGRKIPRREVLNVLGGSLFSHLGLEPDPEAKRRLKKAGLARTIAELRWAERVHEVQEIEVHHLLAELGLPLYVTTNADSFMFEALAQRPGVEPRREGPRWKPRAGSPQWVLDPPPSPREPVVFHLNGFDGDEEQQAHLVLSEDDYLEHLVRLSSEQTSFLPMDLIDTLSRHSFLFLGYHLDDWDFRLLLHGLLKPIERSVDSPRNVGVQLEPEAASNTVGALKFLERYLASFDIDVYWGSTRQFVAELHERWSAADEEW